MNPKEQKVTNKGSTLNGDSQGVERSRSIQDRGFLTALFPLRETEWCQKYCFELLLALGVVLKLHHCPRILREKAYLGMSRYLSQSESEKQWVELAKYLLLYPLARYLKNPEPSRPKTKKMLLFHRRFHNWFSKRIERFSEKNTFFFSSWLQCKRACEPLSELALLESYVKHRKTVLIDDPLTISDYLDIFSGGERCPNFVKLLNMVRKKLHRKLKTLTQGRVSRHACYENSRANGGQRGQFVMKTLGIDKKIIAEEKRGSFSSLLYYSTLMGGAYGEDLITMIYHPRLIQTNGKAQNVPFEVKGLPIQAELEINFKKFEKEHQTCQDPHDLIYCESVDLDGSDAVKIHWKDKYENHVRLPRARIAGIMEPLKTRIVSAGEHDLYFALKKFQTILHGILRKFPLFRLIGRPQSPTDLSDIVPDLRDFAEPSWFSGDYKGSTDALSSVAGRAIMNYITADLPPHISRMALRALGTHRIFYPSFHLGPEEYVQLLRDSPGCLEHMDVKKTWEKGEIVDVQVKIRPAVMRNGQLMGSIVSFPILCLANALVLDLFQTNKKQQSFEAFQRSGLINGDDILCVMDGSEDAKHFERYANALGFELSPGKTYVHPKYANINSASYHYDLTEQKKYQIYHGVEPGSEVNFCRMQNRGPPPSVPREVNYFNSGLFAEKHKVQERVGGESKNEDDVPYDANRNCDLRDPDVYYSNAPGFEESWRGKAEPAFPGDMTPASYSDLPKGALKLIERLVRSGTRVPREGCRPLHAIATRILIGTPPAYRKAVAKDLSSRITDRGEDLCFYRNSSGKWKWFRRNHFLPISAGGLGIQQFSEVPFRVNKIQRQMAAFLEYRERKEKKGQTYTVRPEPSRADPLHNVLVDGQFVKMSKELSADQISTLEEFEYSRMLSEKPRKYLNDTILRLTNPFEENVHNEILEFSLVEQPAAVRSLTRKEICQTAEYVLHGTLNGAKLGYPVAKLIVEHFLRHPNELNPWERGVFSCLHLETKGVEPVIVWRKTIDQMTNRGGILPLRKIPRGVVVLKGQTAGNTLFQGPSVESVLSTAP